MIKFIFEKTNSNWIMKLYKEKEEEPIQVTIFREEEVTQEDIIHLATTLSKTDNVWTAVDFTRHDVEGKQYGKF